VPLGTRRDEERPRARELPLAAHLAPQPGQLVIDIRRLLAGQLPVRPLPPNLLIAVGRLHAEVDGAAASPPITA